MQTHRNSTNVLACYLAGLRQCHTKLYRTLSELCEEMGFSDLFGDVLIVLCSVRSGSVRM